MRMSWGFFNTEFEKYMTFAIGNGADFGPQFEGLRSCMCVYMVTLIQLDVFRCHSFIYWNIGIISSVNKWQDSHTHKKKNINAVVLWHYRVESTLYKLKKLLLPQKLFLLLIIHLLVDDAWFSMREKLISYM